MRQTRLYLYSLVLLQATWRIESFSFCYNASLEGYRLENPFSVNMDASNKIECIISCVKEPCCRSINYRKRLPDDSASRCEMLHDLVFNTSAELKMNSSYDHIYFSEPHKEYNKSCIDDEEPSEAEVAFDLNFSTKSLQNYIILDNRPPEMTQMTLVFWINTVEAAKMAVLSYAVEENAGELGVMVEKDSIIFEVQSLTRRFPVPPVNDGYWHLVGLGWFLGNYSIYLDGTLIYGGSGLGSTLPLKGDGIFAIGQKLLSTNGSFDNSSSFSGKLSQLDMWNSDIFFSHLIMKSISQSCSNAFGSIINWSTVVDWTSGMIIKEHPSSCKPLRNNKDYDVVMNWNNPTAVGKLIHIKISTSFLSLKAVTIAMWEKILYTEHREYVHFVSINGTKLLEFGLQNDLLILKVAGAAKKHARIPMYWKESPAYWHHIATTWSSITGKWKIYLDGSLVSIMHDVALGITIPSGKEQLLGMSMHAQARSLTRLNIWDYELDGLAISLMANKGALFENGNVFAWYGVNAKAVEYVNFQKTPRSDLSNGRESSIYQMNFPRASTDDYVRLNIVSTDNITNFAACFWAKILRTDCAIFTYSTSEREYEIAAYFFDNHVLDLIIMSTDLSSKPKISAHMSWHFYCLQWRSLDGLIETYQDAIKLDDKHKRQGQSIPSGGVLVLGQKLDSDGGNFGDDQAFQGSLAGLNFWSYFLTANEIQGMASGVTNVNGNLLQWRVFKDHIFGAVTIDERSKAEIPEYRVQHLRDKWCKENLYPRKSTYARFIRGRASDGYRWRCTTPTAMLVENMCYDIPKDSRYYYTRDELLGIQ